MTDSLSQHHLGIVLAIVANAVLGGANFDLRPSLLHTALWCAITNLQKYQHEKAPLAHRGARRQYTVEVKPAAPAQSGSAPGDSEHHKQPDFI